MLHNWTRDVNHQEHFQVVVVSDFSFESSPETIATEPKTPGVTKSWATEILVQVGVHFAEWKWEYLYIWSVFTKGGRNSSLLFFLLLPMCKPHRGVLTFAVLHEQSKSLAVQITLNREQCVIFTGLSHPSDKTERGRWLNLFGVFKRVRRKHTRISEKAQSLRLTSWICSGRPKLSPFWIDGDQETQNSTPNYTIVTNWPHIGVYISQRFLVQWTCTCTSASKRHVSCFAQKREILSDIFPMCRWGFSWFWGLNNPAAIAAAPKTKPCRNPVHITLYLFSTLTLLKKRPMVEQQGPKKHSIKIVNSFFITPQLISSKASQGVINQIWKKATLAKQHPQ